MTNFKSMALLDLQIWYRRKCEEHGWRVLKSGQTDREIALARCVSTFNLIKELERQDAAMAKKAKGAEAPAKKTKDNDATSSESKAAAAEVVVETEASETKGKRSKYSSEHLWYVHESNKRQSGSWGSRGMQLIIDEPGISYESFVKAGGRTVDLAWDVGRNNVVFSFEAMEAAQEAAAEAKKA